MTLEFSIADAAGASPEVLAQGAELLAYLTQHMADRRASSGDDLLSQLLGDSDESALTDQEIIGLCFLFLIAGLDTVTAATGFALYELARNPLLRAKLGENYQAASAAFIWAIIARMYAARRTGLKKEKFGYVRGGYARILDRFADVLRREEVLIKLGQPVRRRHRLPHRRRQVRQVHVDARQRHRQAVAQLAGLHAATLVHSHGE